jgi:flagellin-specific chaperone FliS
VADYITFKSFYTKEEAAELVVLLYDKGVASRIQKARRAYSEGASPEFYVEINEDDLIKANNIIENFRTPDL